VSRRLRLTKVPRDSFKSPHVMNAATSVVTSASKFFIRVGTYATEKNNRRFCGYAKIPKVRTSVRSPSRLDSPRLADEERQRACIRGNSNSRSAFRAACILRLVLALKFHPCPSSPLAQPFLTLSHPFQSPTLSLSLSLSSSRSSQPSRYLRFPQTFALFVSPLLTNGTSRSSLSIRSARHPVYPVPFSLCLSFSFPLSLFLSHTLVSLPRTRE